MTVEDTALLRLRLQKEVTRGGAAAVAGDEQASAPFGVESTEEAAWMETIDTASETRHLRSRILIADDSSFVRYGLRKLLVDHGYEVIEASDGEMAVECYATARPEAVLLDITMPKMDGLEALKRIRRLDPTARVAMVTGMGQQSIVIEAVKNGAADFIVKPFDRERVLTAVQKLVAS